MTGKYRKGVGQVKKYWKSIVIAILIVASTFVFVGMSLKTDSIQLFTFENIKGEQSALEPIEVVGDLYDGMSVSLPFKLNAASKMTYLKDGKLGEKSMGYFLPNKLKHMINEDKNFMRSKGFFSEDYFYNDKEKMLYANATMNWFGYASDLMEISVLDKVSEKEHTFEIGIPDAQKYYGFEVVGVFPSGDKKIVVFTQNYYEDGDDSIHAYVINTETESIETDNDWSLENSDSENELHYMNVLPNEGQKEVLIVEQISEYDEENDQEFNQLGEVTRYNLETNETETITLPDTVESLIHFDDDYIYGSKIEEEKIKVTKINRDGNDVEQTTTIDFDLPYTKNSAYQIMSNAKENQLFLLMNDDNNESPTGIAAIQTDTMAEDYVGQLTLRTTSDALERYEYYFNKVELK